MSWQRQQTERRHLASYIVWGLIIAIFVATMIFFRQTNGQSTRWWQEFKSHFSISRIKQRMQAIRHIQEATRALRRKDLPAAEKALRQATQVDPQNRDAWFLLVFILIQQGQMKEAEKTATQAKDPKIKAMAFLVIADEHYLKRNFEQAEVLYRKVLSLDPENATALNNFGYMLAERGVRLDEAEKMIRKALQKEPNNPAFLDSLGWVYYQQEKFQEALRLIEKAVKGDPKNAELRYHLGMVHLKLGERGKAKRELQEAIRLDPTFEPARRALEELERKEQEREMRGETVRT